MMGWRKWGMMGKRKREEGEEEQEDIFMPPRKNPASFPTEN